MTQCSTYMHECLYFTANALARNMGKMADKAFKGTGLSPSHAFMLMLVNEQPGITQKELSEHLSLAPSTLTRFADNLAYRDLLQREHKGKTVRLYPTSAGMALSEPIAQAWKSLYLDYSAILGEKPGIDLTREIDQANKRLDDLA
jgi:DNA-binding MarR family transcriptional regulator